MNEQTIQSELQAAEEYIHNHPILDYSPGDLRRAGKTMDEYLQAFDISEQEVWKEYFEEEI